MKLNIVKIVKKIDTTIEGDTLGGIGGVPSKVDFPREIQNQF